MLTREGRGPALGPAPRQSPARDRARRGLCGPRIGLVLLAGAVLALATGQARSESAEQSQSGVREAFETYRHAVLEPDGDRAVSVLTPDTLDYYGRLQRHALFSSSEAVRALPIMERVQVLFYRVSVPRDELVRMSPDQVVSYAIERGWVGRNELQNSRLGEIEVDTEAGTALAEHLLGGQPTGVRYRFVRSPKDHRWQLDLVPVLEISNEFMKQAAAQAKMSEEDLVLELVRTATESGDPDNVWDPLFPESEGSARAPSAPSQP